VKLNKERLFGSLYDCAQYSKQGDRQRYCCYETAQVCEVIRRCWPLSVRHNRYKQELRGAAALARWGGEGKADVTTALDTRHDIDQIALYCAQSTWIHQLDSMLSALLARANRFSTRNRCY